LVGVITSSAQAAPAGGARRSQGRSGLRARRTRPPARTPARARMPAMPPARRSRPGAGATSRCSNPDRPAKGRPRVSVTLVCGRGPIRIMAGGFGGGVRGWALPPAQKSSGSRRNPVEPTVSGPDELISHLRSRTPFVLLACPHCPKFKILISLLRV